MTGCFSCWFSLPALSAVDEGYRLPQRLNNLRKKPECPPQPLKGAFGFWVPEIPVAYWLAIPMRLQSNGVYYAIVVAECSIAAASAVLFKRGKWKTQKI